MRVLSLKLLATTLSLAAGHQTLRGLVSWAGEEIGGRGASKDAFAGLEDPMRQATDTVRAKNGMEPLTSDLSLSRTALYLATELGKKDQKEAELSPELEKALLERAKAYGFAGTSVKAQVFTYDAKAKGLTAKDSEAHALAAVNYWASKDATAGLEGEREEEMEGEKDATAGVSYTLLGSAGVIAPSGQAYITQVYGSSG